MFRDPNLYNKLRDNFEKDFNFAQQKTFFGLKKEQLFNERYFHSIFIKSLNEIDPSIKLIIFNQFLDSLIKKNLCKSNAICRKNEMFGY